MMKISAFPSLRIISAILVPSGDHAAAAFNPGFVDNLTCTDLVKSNR
jgi:hypothetical protein